MREISIILRDMRIIDISLLFFEFIPTVNNIFWIQAQKVSLMCFISRNIIHKKKEHMRIFFVWYFLLNDQDCSGRLQCLLFTQIWQYMWPICVGAIAPIIILHTWPLPMENHNIFFPLNSGIDTGEMYGIICLRMQNVDVLSAD